MKWEVISNGAYGLLACEYTREFNLLLSTTKKRHFIQYSLRKLIALLIQSFSSFVYNMKKKEMAVQ